MRHAQCVGKAPPVGGHPHDMLRCVDPLEFVQNFESRRGAGGSNGLSTPALRRTESGILGVIRPARCEQCYL